MTPSATTHLLLEDDARPGGTNVLALGDPMYSETASSSAAGLYRADTRLLRLPATAEEAKAVGDVVLLRDKASETGLRAALKREDRWRAVHLACHGLIDGARPMLSSLALSSDGTEDGFLTGIEVLRMDIPADLVVLSACETARGSIAEGEGVLGLMRAFMYAGAPRVLCSLWKVDDEATAALMKRFYALWRAKRSASDALREAQAFVRSHEKWEHPYYWAAWVLWGLDA